MTEVNEPNGVVDAAPDSPAELIVKMRTTQGTTRELAAIALFGPVLVRVRRMVGARMLDKTAADEVESGAMWRLANATRPNGSYKEQDEWDGFVATTVHSSLGDMWRFRTRKPTTSLDSLQEEQNDVYTPTAPSAEEAALALAREWQMFHAFTRAGIPSKAAELCIRRYVHNQSYEEIVADLGGTVGSARVTAHRAMKKMREIYADNPDAIFDS